MSKTTASQRVLVVGAGIAGSVLAFWLAKHDFEVVVVERSNADQKTGQGIEIEEPALQVVKAMGIIDKLREKRTGETGFELVDEQARSRANFTIGDSFSPTGDLEIMRGDLTEVLYKAADEFQNVTYEFETTIHSLTQTDDNVIVELQHRKSKAIKSDSFGFVIGADGARSRTRELVMGSPEKIGCYKPVGAYNAYFSIPKQDQDWPLSRLCHFPGRRIIWTRPITRDSKMTSVYLIHIADNISALREANASGDRTKQKQVLAQLFSGLGWEAPRVIDEMMKAENFYSDELVQVKLDRWSQNRVALLGDAAWAPTPFTGQGTQLAIIGAWVLAQEMSRDRSTAAFSSYEKRLRSHVTESQAIPLGGKAPYIFCPQTPFGIWSLRTALKLLSWVILLASWTKLTSWLPEKPEDVFDLEMES